MRDAVTRAARIALAGVVVLYGVGVAVHIADYKVRCVAGFGGHWTPGAVRAFSWVTPWWAYPLAVVIGLLGLAIAVLIYPRGHTRRRKQPLSGLTY